MIQTLATLFRNTARRPGSEAAAEDVVALLNRRLNDCVLAVDYACEALDLALMHQVSRSEIVWLNGLKCTAERQLVEARRARRIAVAAGEAGLLFGDEIASAEFGSVTLAEAEAALARLRARTCAAPFATPCFNGRSVL